ncbi:uncharacterized protein BP5553_00675 [Venustampulla echinocandica]|uniref:Uncharacterized protein n=1 Tax=Venustampulla echinocandica TaxID=2656787 RepID=A0A370TYT8_9HELO|nr:uncharacterized protein BP5553_00675 [Venustampulla echinocandica]RDL40696.1 hypothetical protein BP5553_00675 [Venustampulla echinocandica]
MHIVINISPFRLTEHDSYADFTELPGWVTPAQNPNRQFQSEMAHRETALNAYLQVYPGLTVRSHPVSQEPRAFNPGPDAAA